MDCSRLASQLHKSAQRVSHAQNNCHAFNVNGLAALPAFSKDPPAKPPSADKPGQVTVTGKVTSFDAGKSIEISSKGDRLKYDLTSTDTVYSVSPDVASGMTVKITEKTDDSGHKTVTIEPRSKAK
jgi:hypothetical protein